MNHIDPAELARLREAAEHVTTLASLKRWAEGHQGTGFVQAEQVLALLAERSVHVNRIAELEKLVAAMADRVAAQSKLLGSVAEANTPAAASRWPHGGCESCGAPNKENGNCSRANCDNAD